MIFAAFARSPLGAAAAKSAKILRKSCKNPEKILRDELMIACVLLTYNT